MLSLCSNACSLLISTFLNILALLIMIWLWSLLVIHTLIWRTYPTVSEHYITELKIYKMALMQGNLPKEKQNKKTLQFCSISYANNILLVNKTFCNLLFFSGVLYLLTDVFCVPLSLVLLLVFYIYLCCT